MNLEPFENKYECSGCHKKLFRRDFHEFNREGSYRPVTSKCRKCRKESRMAKKYPDSICDCCMNHRKLNTNGICSSCNLEAGLRECYTCGFVLPVFICFIQRARSCKDCLKNV